MDDFLLFDIDTWPNWFSFAVLGILVLLVLLLLYVLFKPVKKDEDKRKPNKKEENLEKKVLPAEKVEVKDEDKPASKAVSETKDSSPKKYHVSYNRDKKSDNAGKWRVRKEGSQKTIKFFDTQKEAIDYAQSLADSQGSSIVIHKLDGSIRKQDYSKK